MKLYVSFFLTPSALSPPTGGCLVLSQKKISFVTWLKWQTKIPSPSCSTDPLFPGRLGWARRQQRGRGGGGPLGHFQSLTLGQPFFFFFLVLLSIFVAPETFTSHVKKKRLLCCFFLWLLRTQGRHGVEGTQNDESTFYTH